MRKILSLVLSIAMVMSCFGMTAFAADETTNVWSSSHVTWLSANAMSGTTVQVPPTAETGFAKPSANMAQDDTFVDARNYYKKAALNGAGETTVVYAGAVSDSDSKIVLGGTNTTHYTGADKGYGENDRLAFTMYVNLVEGELSSVAAMRGSAGVDVTTNMGSDYLNSHKGQWVRLDAFIQPKVTYTYTRTNKATSVVEENLIYERIGFINNKADVATGAVLADMPGYDADTYTYAVTKVAYGKMSSYINGECVKNEEQLISTSGNPLTFGYDNSPTRIAFLLKDKNVKTSMYVSHAQIYKVSNFDPETLELAKSPVLADGEKYIVGKNYVELADANVTVADIATSDDYVVNVYSSDDTTYSTPEAAEYVIKEGDTIAVRNGVLNIKYYKADIVEVNETAADDNGNIFTWKFSPETGLLSVGIKEVKVYADDKKTKVKMTYAKAEAGDNSAIYAACPWLTFSNKNLIKDIEIDSRISHVVRQAFYGLTGLEEITLPANVEGWGWGAFGSCTNLKKVSYEFGSKVSGGDKMFVGCTNLSEVILPPTVYAVSGRCFWNCKSLKELMITATHNQISIPNTAFGADNEANGLNITLKYYDGSEAAAKVTAVTSPANYSTVTSQAVAPAGLLPDRNGNADSIGWEVKNGVARVYDVIAVGNGDMPLGNTGHGAKSSLPWCYFGQLDEVIVEEGITSLSQWGLQDVKATTVTLPSTIVSSDPYVFNGANPITNIVFKEGFGAMNRAQIINRNCNISNIYLPSTATSISNSIFRGLHKDDADVYQGGTTVNFIAPKDSYAYTWAENMKANVTTDKAVTINVSAADSDRLYSYAVSGYKTSYSPNNTSGLSIGNGVYKCAEGADGGYDTALAMYSTVKGQNNAFFYGPAYKRDIFGKRAYTVFEADVKFGANGAQFFFGSDQHKHVGDSAIPESALVKDGWNKLVTVVDYNTGVSKTYINGIYAATTNESALWKDGDQYTTKDGDGNPVVKDCTSTRFVAYDLNGISDTVPMVYVDNMAIYATDVNPADAYVAPLTATAFDAATGVTFTASADVKALNGNIVIAVAYDADNNMVGNVVMDTDEVTIAPVAGATKYVGYVWNSIDGLVPIAASVPVDAQ